MPQTRFHLDPDNPLKRRLSGRIPVNQVLGQYKFSKHGRIQRVLHTLKYKNEPDLGISLGRVYGQKLKDSGTPISFDVIVPVPLHETRLRKRGYNQSSKYAAGLAEVMAIPLSEDILVRVKNTQTQTRKSKLNRWENVSDVFRVRDRESLSAKRVLLVDDVVTTGATIEACGQVLLENGCQELSIACIAVA